MGRRMIVSAALALALTAGLAGCQATTSGFTRASAKADAAHWTSQAVAAAGSPAPSATTRTNGFETCRSDHSYFAATSQWRTITNIAVPSARQAAVTAAISDAFLKQHWTSSRKSGLLTLIGPTGAKLKGLVTVQTAGGAALALTVISPCYK